MKTSRKSIMMGMALAGCLIFSATDATAQSRINSQGSAATSSRSQSVAVPSTNNSNAQQVNRPSASQVNRQDATQRVNRPSESQVNRQDATQQVNHLNTRVLRDRNDNSTHNNDNSNTSPRVGSATTRPGSSSQTRPSKPGSGGKPGSGDSPGSGGAPGTPPHPGDVSPGTPPHPGDGSPDIPPPHPPVPPRPPVPPHPSVPPCPDVPPPLYMVHIGYGPDNPYDYSDHRYSSKFSWNYDHHNWSSPLPPPTRRYRPSFRGWFRPVKPIGWYSNVGSPMIDNILGIPFGADFDDALDFLYYNGYFIDGYANSIVYLRAVPMLNMTWDDVMLAFDTMDRLVNAEFVIRIGRHVHTNHLTQCTNSNDNNYCKDCYDRVYRSLCYLFGAPFQNSSNSVSWYDGDNTGWITMSTFSSTESNYVMLSIGY